MTQLAPTLPARPATGRLRRPAALLPVLLCLTLVLGACSSTRHRAPVETRTSSPRPPVAAPVPPVAPADAAPGTVEARPSSVDAKETAVQAGGGTYVVKPGDTLIRIGLETGQNWRDIARWNGTTCP